MNRNSFLSIAERVVSTFLFAFLATWIPVLMSVPGTSDWHSLLALSVMQKAAIAGLAAVLSLIKSIIATQVGNPNSGGLLPNAVLKAFGAATWKSAPAPVVIPPTGAGALPKVYIPTDPVNP